MWILVIGGAIIVAVVLGLLVLALCLSQSREQQLLNELATFRRQSQDSHNEVVRAKYETTSATARWDRFWAGGPITHSMKKVLDILEHHVLDDGRAPLPFSKRLAEANGWDEAFTAAAIVEYKRFLALSVTTGITVTPSKVVDEVWHLHLQYTQNYWSLCRELGVAIHHNPSRGDEVDEAKYPQAFLRTLACYQVVFQTSAPTLIWGEIPAAVQALVEEQQKKVDLKIEEERRKKRGRQTTVSNPYMTTRDSASSDDGSMFIHSFLLWNTVISSTPPNTAGESSSSHSPTVGIPMNDSFSASIASCGGGGGGGSSSYSSDGGSSFGGGSSCGSSSGASCGGGGGGASCGGGGGASCGGGGM